MAGVEADKTNEFLQLLAKAADRRLDTTEAIELVKSGKTDKKDQRKESKQPTKSDAAKTSKAAKDTTATSKRPKNDAKQAAAAAKPTKKVDGRAKVSKQDSKSSDEVKRSRPKQSPRGAVEPSSNLEVKSTEPIQRVTVDEPLSSQPEKSVGSFVCSN